MNILRIAWKNIRQTFQRPIGIVLLILGPLVLMIILGQAFAGIFSMGMAAPKMTIGYFAEEKGILYDSFRDFLAGFDSFLLTSQEVESIETGELKTREGVLEAFIILNERKKELELVLNDNTGIQAGIIEGILNGFIDRFAFYSLVNQHDPVILSNLIDKQDNYITHTTLRATRQPRAIDYFGITIITMSVLFGAFLGMHGIEKEKTMGTLQRLYSAPVTRLQFLLGTCLGTMTALAIQLSTILIIGKYVLGIYYGERFLLVIGLLSGESLFALALGIGMASLFSDSKTMMGILNMIIPLMNFMGGSYMKLPETPFFEFLSRLSPVGWMNKALFELIFSTTYTFVIPAFIYCTTGAVILLGLSVFKSLRRRTI